MCDIRPGQTTTTTGTVKVKREREREREWNKAAGPSRAARARDPPSSAARLGPDRPTVADYRGSVSFQLQSRPDKQIFCSVSKPCDLHVKKIKTLTIFSVT